MKVVFLDTVETAQVGEVRDVKNGYARNFLLPRGLALPATKEAIERAQARLRAADRKQAALDAESKKLVTNLGSQPLILHARVGETGRLYGSVTASDIAEALALRAGSEIDRRTIELPEPIRQVGEYEVHMRLTRNVSTTITVVVQPEAEAETE